MGLFSRVRKNSAWLALGLFDDGVYAVSIEHPPTGMPQVRLAAFYPTSKPQSLDTLEKVGKELHASRYRCLTPLAAGEYQLLSVEAPNVPADEVRMAVRWRLKDMIDFRIDDAAVDVIELAGDPNASVRNDSLFAVVARNSVIQQRQQLFADAKLGLSVIDIPEMGQRNISALLEPEGRGVALLSFHADGGLLTVTYGGELYLARRIDVGLEQLQDADPERRTVFHEKITLELQRSLDHFDRQFHFIMVAKLVLAPLAVPDLHEYLAPNLYMPVEQLDLASLLDLSAVPELLSVEVQQRYFLILGAALRQEKAAP